RMQHHAVPHLDDLLDDVERRRQQEGLHLKQVARDLPNDEQADEEDSRQETVEDFRHGAGCEAGRRSAPPRAAYLMNLLVQSFSSGIVSFWPPYSTCSFWVDAHFSFVIT